MKPKQVNQAPKERMVKLVLRVFQVPQDSEEKLAPLVCVTAVDVIKEDLFQVNGSHVASLDRFHICVMICLLLQDQ